MNLDRTQHFGDSYLPVSTQTSDGETQRIERVSPSIIRSPEHIDNKPFTLFTL